MSLFFFKLFTAPVVEGPPRSPNPNNPSEYCSKVPPNQQASGHQGNPPTVMVPTGVLKSTGRMILSNYRHVICHYSLGTVSSLEINIRKNKQDENNNYI